MNINTTLRPHPGAADATSDAGAPVARVATGEHWVTISEASTSSAPGDSMSELAHSGELRRRTIETPSPPPVARAPQESGPLAVLGLPPDPLAPSTRLNLIRYGLLIGGGITAAHTTITALLFGGALETALTFLASPLSLLVCAAAMMMLGYRLRSMIAPNLALGGPEVQLRAWHQALQLPFERRPWHQERSGRIAGFMVWLYQVHGFASSLDAPNRTHLLRVIRHLLSAIDEDRALRDRVLHVIESHQGLWNTPVPLMLELMSATQQVVLAERGQLPRQGLFRLARGEFRLAMLRELSNERRPFNDLQRGLHVRLDLPLRRIELDQVFSLPHEEIESVGNAVLRFENQAGARQSLEELDTQLARLSARPRVALPELKKHPLALALATSNPLWQAHIDNTAGASRNTVKKQVSEYQTALDDPGEDAPSLCDFDYLRSANEAMFLYNHGTAYREALRAIVADSMRSGES